MLKQSRGRNTLVGLGAVLTGLALLTVCPSVGAEPLKIGYVDMGRVFDSYERTRQSEGTLERQGEQKEVELAKRVKQLKRLRESLELLSDQARETKAREIEEQADSLRRFTVYTKRDLAQQRDHVAGDIIREIRRMVEAYASANEFSLILDERSLLYGQEVHDITDAVLKELNTQHAKQSHARR